jgi:hypothetical protein
MDHFSFELCFFLKKNAHFFSLCMDESTILPSPNPRELSHSRSGVHGARHSVRRRHIRREHPNNPMKTLHLAAATTLLTCVAKVYQNLWSKRIAWETLTFTPLLVCLDVVTLYIRHLLEEVFQPECTDAVSSVPCLIGFQRGTCDSARFKCSQLVFKNKSDPYTFYHVKTNNQIAWCLS